MVEGETCRTRAARTLLLEEVTAMSPSELMIRTIHWVCASCGEMTRTPRRPRACLMCGRAGSDHEQGQDIALPSD